ncbi:hypothetical protein ACX9NE_20905 [Mycobacterium sp. ML4]
MDASEQRVRRLLEAAGTTYAEQAGLDEKSRTAAITTRDRCHEC